MLPIISKNQVKNKNPIESVNYIVSYLQQLVAELQRYVNKLNQDDNEEKDLSIVDIDVSNGKMTIKYNNGNYKTYDV